MMKDPNALKLEPTLSPLSVPQLTMHTSHKNKRG